MFPLDSKLQEGKAHSYLVHRCNPLVLPFSCSLNMGLCPLPCPLCLTRHRGQFYLQAISHLELYTVPLYHTVWSPQWWLSRVGWSMSWQVDIPASSLSPRHSAIKLTFLKHSLVHLMPCCGLPTLPNRLLTQVCVPSLPRLFPVYLWCFSPAASNLADMCAHEKLGGLWDWQGGVTEPPCVSLSMLL